MKYKKFQKAVYTVNYKMEQGDLGKKLYFPN